MIFSGEISNWFGYGVPGKHVNYATEHRNTGAIVSFRLDIFGFSLPSTLNWYITRVSGAGIDFSATSGVVALPYGTNQYFQHKYGRFNVAITNDTIDETGYKGELFTINVNTGGIAGIISHNFTLYDVDFAATITNSGDITNASGINPSIYTFNVINNGTWAHSNAKWHDGAGNFLGTAAYGGLGTTSANNFAGSSLPGYGQYKTYKLSAHNGHSYYDVAESTIFREIPIGATLSGASSVTISSGDTSAVQFNFTNTSGTNVFRYYRVRRHSPSLDFGHLVVSSTMTMIIPSSALPAAGGSFTYSLQMSDGRAYQTVGTPVTVTRGAAAESVVAGTSSGLVITNENTTGQTLNTSFNFSDTGAGNTMQVLQTDTNEGNTPSSTNWVDLGAVAPYSTYSYTGFTQPRGSSRFYYARRLGSDGSTFALFLPRPVQENTPTIPIISRIDLDGANLNVILGNNPTVDGHSQIYYQATTGATPAFKDTGTGLPPAGWQLSNVFSANYTGTKSFFALTWTDTPGLEGASISAPVTQTINATQTIPSYYIVPSNSNLTHTIAVSNTATSGSTFYFRQTSSSTLPSVPADLSGWGTGVAFTASVGANFYWGISHNASTGTFTNPVYIRLDGGSTTGALYGMETFDQQGNKIVSRSSRLSRIVLHGLYTLEEDHNSYDIPILGISFSDPSFSIDIDYGIFANVGVIGGPDALPVPSLSIPSPNILRLSLDWNTVPFVKRSTLFYRVKLIVLRV